MKSLKRNSIIWGGVALAWLSAAAVYLFFLRTEVVLYFSGESSGVFASLAESFYPRLITERERFSSDFFLKKADHIIIRSGFVLLAFLLFNFIYSKKYFKGLLKKLLKGSESGLRSLWLMRILIYGTALYFSSEWYEILLRQGAMHEFYEPISFYGFLSYPSKTRLSVLLFTLYASLIISAFGIRFFPFIASVLFIFCQGFLYAFGKIDYTFIPWNIALILMAFILHTKGKKQVKLWLLLCLSLTLPYFFSGMEKLTLSFTTWPETFASHLQNRETTLVHFLQENSVLNFLTAWFVLFFQLLSPLALYSSSTKSFWALAVFLFHTGVFLAVGIGGFFHPWAVLVMLVFAVPEAYNFFGKIWSK